MVPMPGSLLATSTTGRPTPMTTLGSAASGNFTVLLDGLARAKSASGLARAITITDQAPCFRAQVLKQNMGLYQGKGVSRATKSSFPLVSLDRTDRKEKENEDLQKLI